MIQFMSNQNLSARTRTRRVNIYMVHFKIKARNELRTRVKIRWKNQGQY